MNAMTPAVASDTVLHAHLSMGQISLRVANSDMAPTDLLCVAERQNPKRAFLFVSKVLGRHIPVTPRAHNEALTTIANKAVSHVLPGPVLVMGFAETAVGLGGGVARAIGAALPHQPLLFLPTTRHPGNAEPWFCFSEDHSHATAHTVLKPEGDIHTQARTLVLVDDEVTTGATCANLVRAAREAGRVFERVIIATLTDWSNGRAVQTLADAAQIAPENVYVVSLLQGDWSWQANPTATPPVLPGSVPALDTDGVARSGDWRKGSAFDIPFTLHDAPSQRILVIGTGEYVWQPFVLAEALETEGHAVSFCATTRSPVMQGDVIRHKLTFADHYGLGIAMYLHNVAPNAWDSILLCIEREDTQGLCPTLIAGLGTFKAVTPSGRIFTFEKGVELC